MSKLLLWFSVMIPLAFSAGPANITMAAMGARFGLKKALPFLFGITVTTLIFGFIIGFGVGNVLLNFTNVFPYVQLTGALYMFYLAYKFFSKAKAIDIQDDRLRPRFIDGVILQIFNAKMIMVKIMMFSQFLDQESTVALQVFILSFGLIGLTLTANSLWAAGGAWLMRAFATEKALRVQGYLFGSMLAAVGVWMFYGSWVF